MKPRHNDWQTSRIKVTSHKRRKRPIGTGGVPCPFRLSVCSARPSVGNDREFWKNGRLDRDAIWGGGLGGPMNHVLDEIPDPPC